MEDNLYCSSIGFRLGEINRLVSLNELDYYESMVSLSLSNDVFEVMANEYNLPLVDLY